MANEAFQPGTPEPTPPADTAVRAGSPGRPSDVVLASRQPAKKTVEKPPEIKDPYREIVETIVFVVVLVFMLKTFLAEAFVIPTGSMATTLLGYHKDVICQQCGYDYRVNASSEAEPQDGFKQDVVTSKCPNCAFRNNINGPFAGGRP